MYYIFMYILERIFARALPYHLILFVFVYIP